MTEPAIEEQDSEDVACRERTTVGEVEAEARSSRRLSWHTRRFLIVFFALGFATGAIDPAENSDVDFLLSVGMAFSMAWWTITDASDRGHPFRMSIRLLVIVFGGLAAPLYVLWTRRLMGIAWISLVALGLVIAAEAGYYASLAISEGLVESGPVIRRGIVLYP